MDRIKLDAMSELSIEDINKDQLKSLSDVQLDRNASQVEKVIAFIEQIKNPYCFLCDKTPVRVCFAKGGKNINQAMENIFKQMRQT